MQITKFFFYFHFWHICFYDILDSNLTVPEYQYMPFSIVEIGNGIIYTKLQFLQSNNFRNSLPNHPVKGFIGEFYHFRFRKVIINGENGRSNINW